ncbi:hypothetical protein OIU34_19245 [Pararhizobium sp. BT-229]|uniref:hypothetical protein n=1 Tax=Pararhizobium sp. BT-229 TaxID=2986923 RepID=UPI0021F7BDA5|nr:hypothetical protein [Pararhizobium sp. BT-229]MCV9964019.1 hypothetical protein [Pararhizobium sp. BT-229]
MKRIEFLKKKWSKRVAEVAQSGDHSMARDIDVFDYLLSADPSPKKLYAEFVMRTYASGEYLAEDVERIRESLSLFHVNKRRLPVERRDIGNYPSERDLWTVLTEAGLVESEAFSGKAAKRSDRSRAHLESDVITADGWTMVRLGSAFSAAWWGMGTRWCTTEKSGRTYKSYADRGALRVFVSPEGVKHQLHIATGSLCDAKDMRVNLTKFLGTIPPEFIPSMRADVGELCERMMVPVDGLSPEHEFRYRFNSILRLPQEFFSAEVTEAVDRLRRAGLEQLGTLCECAGWTLKATRGDFTSWALHTELGIDYEGSNRYLLLVVRPDGTRVVSNFGVASMESIVPVVVDMPAPLRETFLSKAVGSWTSGDREAGVALHNLISSVPPGELSASFWQAWAKRLGGHDVNCRRRNTPEERFGSIPDEAVTEKVALVFAKQGTRDRIPDGMLTRDVARTLAKADPASRNDPEITVLFTLDDIADIYGGNGGRNLGGLPAEYRTYDMARRIVKERRGALRELLKMVRAGDFDLGGLPVDAVVEELSLAAIADSAASLIDVDIPLTRNTYLDIVRRDAGMLSWVPLAYRDVELCSASKIHSEHGLCHFPEWVVTEIRDANDGKHGITHNYRPSMKYAATLRGLSKQDGDVAAALPPFSVQALVAELGARA